MTKKYSIIVGVLLSTLIMWAGGLSLQAQEAAPEATPAAAAEVAPATLGLSGRQIMDKVKEHTNNLDEMSNVEMVLISKSGSQRSREMFIKRKRDPQTDLDKIMIRFKAPEDIRGTTLLTWEEPTGKDDQQWIYLPALKKTKKIAGASKQDDFVGSDLTYEDMRPESLDDYTYAIVQEDQATVVVDATAKVVGDSGYSKRRLTIQKSNFIILSADYFDKNGALLKQLKGSEFVEVEAGRWRTNNVHVKNVQNGHATTLKAKARKLNTGLKDSDFTKRELEKGV